ncbi:MAG: DUF433 domain-containing protein [Gammaproteobacteria bacterium]
MDYRQRITIEPGKRGGKPCIRGMRITVYDVLEYLASGMTVEEILADFDYLTREDIQACLAYAADRERHQLIVNA